MYSFPFKSADHLVRIWQKELQTSDFNCRLNWIGTSLLGKTTENYGKRMLTSIILSLHMIFSDIKHRLCITVIGALQIGLQYSLDALKFNRGISRLTRGISETFPEELSRRSSVFLKHFRKCLRL